MKILVCVKQVPDTTEVKLSSDFTLQRDFIAMVMNPADESALELGLRLKQKHGGAVTVLSMGPMRAQAMLREALSRGADQAVLLSDAAFAGADTLVTAKCLKAAAEKLGGFDLILCGRRAVDGETGQVGPMTASLLDMPCVANAIQADSDGQTLTACQLTEAGHITWKTPLPAAVTFCEWSYRLRLPTLPGIKRAAKAQIQVLTPADLGLPASKCGIKASPTRVVHVESRPVCVRPCQKTDVRTVLAQLTERGLLP
ncbi:MAG: electron transfer flavoprotein subunit beta/FixA family protein [Candidatus Limiplasma sp.]|nr:electron transfer flavoprotein subunit beta/FixA family protein [Clostridiales bacterium]MDY3815807.1 electron transfer flavoprotein subunit beta/FixA family protein [Candidatus Limiplasma sp.]